jgi:hypothetical protein
LLLITSIIIIIIISNLSHTHQLALGEAEDLSARLAIIIIVIAVSHDAISPRAEEEHSRLHHHVIEGLVKEQE